MEPEGPALFLSLFSACSFQIAPQWENLKNLLPVKVHEKFSVQLFSRKKMFEYVNIFCLVKLSLKQAHTSLISLAAELSMNKLEAALILTFFFCLFVCFGRSEAN